MRRMHVSEEMAIHNAQPIKYFEYLLNRICDIPSPMLRLEVGASRVIPSHEGKLTERSPCVPRFHRHLDHP